METKKAPLSIYLLWHGKYKNREVIEYCFNKLHSNIKKPFSRGINIPVFFRTNTSISNKPISLDIHQSDKTAIFVFIDAKMVIDKEWSEYINNLYTQWQTNHNIMLCPVSLDKTAFNINSPINKINYIRYHVMDKKEKNHLLFISIANEICKFINNQSECVAGGEQNRPKPVKLFLSHTKADEKAVDLGHKIKDRIDNTTLNRFFDAYDIPPAHDFKDEIEEQLADSTILSIHSDSYSSRPWCQKEILFAKKYHRPMVIVDFLENYEDRRFPYISNAPTFHISPDTEDLQEKIPEILEVAMLETLRFIYCKLYLEHLQEIGLAPPDYKLLCHPPELKDLQDDAAQILYPDPPVEYDEGEILSLANKNCITPLTWRNINLKGLEIGISISEPDKEELLYLGFFQEHINLALNEISRHLLMRNAHLSYGGDLRPGGFTNFLFEIAACQKQKLKDEFIKVTNYQFWPIYKLKENDEWIASNYQLADFIEIGPPGDIKQEVDEIDHFVPPDTVIHQYFWARSLTRMRREMIRASDARVCIGGRTFGYKGKMPGVLEEILLAMEYNKPLYLNGCFGGVAGAVIDLLRGNKNNALTLDWQVAQSPPYAKLVEYFNEHKPAEESGIDYEKIQQTISGYSIEMISENNGLSVDENTRLFHTNNVFELISLILKGLSAVKEKK